MHEPAADDREPRTRPKVWFFDRVKVLLIVAVWLGLAIAYEHSSNPLMSWGDAFRDQWRAKWWLLVVAGLEVVRQLHYLVAERAAGWHRFWDHTVFGGWERRMSRLNPWLRYRMRRQFKGVVVIVLLGFVLSWKWGLSWLDALSEAPARFFDNFFGTTNTGVPLGIWIFIIISMSLIQLAVFYAIFFVGGVETYKPGEMKTRFRDVWGQDPVLSRVRETVDFLDRPAEIEAKGGYIPNGILLWGPPGTGKTLMAEAIAGETGKPYVFVDPSAFIQTFVGVAPMKIKWMYRKLRKLALKHGGVVVFFDEADALGNRGQVSGEFEARAAQAWRASHACNGHTYISDSSRAVLWEQHLAEVRAAQPEEKHRGGRRGIIIGGGGGMSWSGALQSLLTEMSGLNKPRGFFSRRLRQFLGMKPKLPPKYRILHIMATNRPDALDAALLRPGRIDRKYKVGYPHAEGRQRTFQGYFDKIRHELTPRQIERLALITPYYTGAMIKDIVNESVIVAMRGGRDVVTWTDVLKAKLAKTHGEADDWKYTDLERHQVALHEACHAVAMFLLRKRHSIDVATIERRGEVGGFVAPVPLEERFSEWRSEMEIDVMTYLASLAGERLFFEGDNSAGVGGDLGQSTRMVVAMLTQWGMGDNISSRAGTPGQGGTMNFRDSTQGGAVEAKLQELLARVRNLLDQHRWFVFAVAHALEKHLTITGEDIEAIYRGTKGPNVDGWTYHTDDFRISYEAYHLAALDAHRRQEKHLHPLPDFAPPVPAAGSWLTLPPPRLVPPPPPAAGGSAAPEGA